jgi:hypothetical protein
MSFKPLLMIKLYIKSIKSLEYAKKRGTPGVEFAEYGRRLGWRLLVKGKRSGWEYVINPVSITRFFEFDFALSCLQFSPEKCLDVSSPRLFSLYVLSKGKVGSVEVINPDEPDFQTTTSIINAINLKNIKASASAIHAVPKESEKFSCIWSLSVIEHIHGEYDDVFAVKHMYDLLEPGGRLIITVPVDKIHWDEHRDFKSYETQKAGQNGKYFFQRWYDEKSIEERLFEGINARPCTMKWYGEINPGRFHAYIKEWLRYGRECTVNDPREVSDYYKEYSSWEEMPGCGICCFMITKNEN